MAGAQGTSPDSAEVTAQLRKARARHPEWVKVRTVAETEEGRPIQAVTITDPGAPERDKQHVLVTAGHHGNEDSGRLIALTLVDWLLSEAAEETRRKQKIVVMPNMSPDAAERDCYFVEGSVNPLLDHSPEGPQTVQGKALESEAEALAPEVYVDLHSRGYAGCSYDMVLWPDTRPYLEDDNLLHAIAAEMGAAGERGGVPHLVHPLSWPGFLRDSPDTTSACAYAYRTFKSLAFLTETAEDNAYSLPAAVRARTGLARLKALLAWGNRRHPKLPYPGYPCYLVGGMLALGLVAVGATAAARRKSRLSIWPRRGGFAEYRAIGPEQPDRKVLQVKYQGEPLIHGIGFQMAVRGRREVARATIAGRRLRPSGTHGYLTWEHRGMTCFVIAVPELQPGEYEIEILLR